MESEPSVDSSGPHVIDRLAEYLSGSLEPADDVAVESHLLTCTACRDEYDELGDAALMVTMQPDGALDDSTPDGH